MALDLANIKSITTKSGVTIKKVQRKSDGKIMWSADVPDVVHTLNFSYGSESAYYATGATTAICTLLSGVDLSLYSGAELTLYGADLETSYAWSDAYLYLTDESTNAEISHMSLDADGNEYQARTNLAPTLTFASTSGTANISIVLYTEEMNEVAYTITGGTLKLIGRKA